MPNNFRVVFKPEKFQQSLTRLVAQFTPAMLGASRNIMRSYMTMVMDMTPKPGDPDEGFNKEYVRTGRLVGGWGAATSALGMPTPFGSEEGAFWQVVNDDGVTLFARNDVSYAPFVEYIGPWLIPPNAPGGPKWRGGRHMVENARNNVLGGGIITREVNAAWKGIIR